MRKGFTELISQFGLTVLVLIIVVLSILFFFRQMGLI